MYVCFILEKLSEVVSGQGEQDHRHAIRRQGNSGVQQGFFFIAARAASLAVLCAHFFFLLCIFGIMYINTVKAVQREEAYVATCILYRQSMAWHVSNSSSSSAQKAVQPLSQQLVCGYQYHHLSISASGCHLISSISSSACWHGHSKRGYNNVSVCGGARRDMCGVWPCSIIHHHQYLM